MEHDQKLTSRNGQERYYGKELKNKEVVNWFKIVAQNRKYELATAAQKLRPQ